MEYLKNREEPHSAVELHGEPIIAVEASIECGCVNHDLKIIEDVNEAKEKYGDSIAAVILRGHLQKGKKPCNDDYRMYQWYAPLKEKRNFEKQWLIMVKGRISL